MSIIDVNVNGTLYTWKLAVHYFRKQPDTDERDRCFIMTGSMVSWIDSPVDYGFAPRKMDCTLIDDFAGKLAVHGQQVRAQGPDADRAPEHA